MGLNLSSDTLELDWPGLPASVGVLSTLRRGGLSVAPYDDGKGGGGLNLGLHVGDDLETVIQNRALLRQHLPAEPWWLTQVHGTRVLGESAFHSPNSLAQGLQAHQADQAPEAHQFPAAPEADASISARPGQVCAIMTADCMPVLLADARGRVVAAAHAGWRGLAAGVLENTVQAMRSKGADELLVWLGPGIGPQRFEVGEDVRTAFRRLGSAADAAFLAIPGKTGKYLANLPQLARLALASEGVTQVAGGSACTVSEPERFYSFRRDRVTGRMASMIWIK